MVAEKITRFGSKFKEPFDKLRVNGQGGQPFVVRQPINSRIGRIAGQLFSLAHFFVDRVYEPAFVELSDQA